MIQLDSPFVLSQAVATIGKAALLVRLEALGHAEIGMPDVKLLWCLGDEPVNVQQVAQMTGTTKQFAARTVSKLRAAGLVAVHRHPTDKRAIGITATHQGAALTAVIARERDAIELGWRKVLGTADFERVARLLARLAEGLMA